MSSENQIHFNVFSLKSQQFSDENLFKVRPKGVIVDWDITGTMEIINTVLPVLTDLAHVPSTEHAFLIEECFDMR